MNHTSFLDQALALAQSVRGLTAPNPPVGAVLVKDGRILGTGVHTGPGQPHAEAAALADCLSRGYSPRGATLYVSLEPCCHTGPGKRTPPCAQRLLAEGVAEVWAGCVDPNPAVAGQGLELLRRAGVTIHLAPDPEPFADLIREFRIWILEKRAAFHLKWAQSLDGKLAAADGSSRWLSGPEALDWAQDLRTQHQAVLVGAGTLRADDPQLTVRGLGKTVQPQRLIVAGDRPLPERARVFTDGQAATWIIARAGTPAYDQATMLTPGRLIVWDGQDWPALGRELFARGMYSVLVEGGAAIHASLLRAGLWDRLSVVVTPKLLGRGTAVPGDLGTDTLSAALALPGLTSQSLGADLLLTTQREAVCLPV